MLSGARVARLLRLVTDLQRGAADRDAQERQLLAGLCDLVGAATGALVDCTDFGPGRRGNVLAKIDVGLDASSQTFGWPLYAERGIGWDPLVAALMERPGGAVDTARRQDAVTGPSWYRSSHVAELRRPLRLDDCLYSVFREDEDGRAHVLCLNRAWGERPFSDEDRDLLHVMHESLGWLYRPTPSGLDRLQADLPPSLRRVLPVLALGKTDKEIATELGLATNTVRDYVQQIFRRIGVTTRAQLVRRCFAG